MRRLKKIEICLRKLCKSSLPELWCRAIEYAHRLNDRFNCRFPSQRIITTSFEQLCQRAADLFPGQTASNIRLLLNESSTFADKLREQIFSRYGAGADNVFWLFDIKLDIFKPICWHIDPKLGSLWPRSFYGNICLADAKSSRDVKYIWELGRQLFVVELARRWAVSRDDRAASRAVELIDSFLRENPPYIGVHWTSALEVAVRSIHWLWAIAALADWHGFSREFQRRFLSILTVNADFLLHHLSYYSSPYNHIIGEATALYLLSYVLKDERRAHRWAGVGRKVLEHFAPRQFYKDGVSVEQSLAYHFYTLGFLMQAVMCARLQGQGLPQVEDVVPHAVRASLAFQQPDGSWPPIGDADSARSIPVVPARYWDFTGSCNLAAVLWREPNLVANGKFPGQEITWLLGYEGIRIWRDLVASPTAAKRALAKTSEATIAVLADSGYAIVRSPSHFLAFDSGPLAAGVHADGTPSAAHGHADMLHLIYWRDGQQWLFDSGVYCYNGDIATLKHCRSPQAHSTIEIDGCPVAVDLGGLTWAYVTKPAPMNVIDLPTATVICANWRYGTAAHVWRYIAICQAGPLLIIDRIVTDRERLAYWNWQLPIGSRMISQLGGHLTLKSDSHRELFEVRFSHAVKEVELNQGGDSPAGWRYHAYRSRQLGCRVRVGVLCPAEVVCVTAVRRPDEAAAVSFGRDHHVRLGPEKNLAVVYEDCDASLTVFAEERNCDSSF